MQKRYHKDRTKGFQKGYTPWNKGTKGLRISPNTEFKKGHIPWNKEKNCAQFTGENNPAWRGGVSKSVFYNRLCLYNQRFKKRYGPLLIETIQQVYEDNIKRHGTLTCYLCLKPVEFGEDTLEHKIPLSRGGSNNKTNLDVAHRLCNLKKGQKTDKEFINQGGLR
jgi:5-methylcytosine-specific restriction endonuclease McrA